jgi:hypothetical protein
VAEEVVGDEGRARERLVDLHGCAAGVGEDVADTAALEGLDEDVSALAGLGWAPWPERGCRRGSRRRRGHRGAPDAGGEGAA